MTERAKIQRRGSSAEVTRHTFILAGTLRQAMFYAEHKGLSMAQVILLSTPQQLFGTEEPTVLKVGAWREHPHLAEFEQAFAMVKAKVRVD